MAFGLVENWHTTPQSNICGPRGAKSASAARHPSLTMLWSTGFFCTHGEGKKGWKRI